MKISKPPIFPSHVIKAGSDDGFAGSVMVVCEQGDDAVIVRDMLEVMLRVQAEAAEDCPGGES
ncbi:MAG: hypothetical protein AAF196_09095 [Planctomycetota bacterium]